MKVGQAAEQNETGTKFWASRNNRCNIQRKVPVALVNIFDIATKTFRVWILSATFGSNAFTQVSNGRTYLVTRLLYYLGLGCSGSFRVSPPVRPPCLRPHCFSVRQSSALHPFRVDCSLPSTFLNHAALKLFNCSCGLLAYKICPGKHYCVFQCLHVLAEAKYCRTVKV
jgi:hypothetical protein